jgi:hypothetical protein
MSAQETPFPLSSGDCLPEVELAYQVLAVRWIRFSWTRDWGIIRDQGEPGDGKRAG